MKTGNKSIIGRLEKVHLPEWGLEDIDAKVDTGAYSSSLHCHHIHLVDGSEGKKVRFNLLDPDHPAYNERLFELDVHDRREVKSSNGIAEERVFVKTKIRIGNDVYDIELSLADRSEMKYPLLLGRKFLRERFLVDVSKTNLSNND